MLMSKCLTCHNTLSGDVASLTEPQTGVHTLVQPLTIPLIQQSQMLKLKILCVEVLDGEVSNKLMLHPGLSAHQLSVLVLVPVSSGSYEHLLVSSPGAEACVVVEIVSHVVRNFTTASLRWCCRGRGCCCRSGGTCC